MAQQPLEKSQKKSCGHKDKARQACSCLHIQILCLFSSSDFPLSTPPLSHFSLLFPPVPLPLAFPSSAVASLRWGFLQGFHAMFCWAASLPSAQRPGTLDWLRHTGRGPGVWSLCSGQLAEQMKVKHLGLGNQRHCSDLTCRSFAEYYVTES